MLIAVLVATPLALLPYALAPSVGLAAAGIVVVGGAYICILSGLSAVMQLRAPEEFRGRVLSLCFAVPSIVFPLGALVQGVAARRIGLRATTIAGAALFLGLLALVALLRPRVLAALADEAPGPSLGAGGEPDVPVVTHAATAPAVR